MGLSLKKLSLCLFIYLSVSGMESEVDVAASQRVVATLLALDGYADHLIGVRKNLADLGVFSANFDQSVIALILQYNSREDISPKFKSRIKTRVDAFHNFFLCDLSRTGYWSDLLLDKEPTIDARLYAAIEAKRVLPSSRLVGILGKHVAFLLTLDLRDSGLDKDIKLFEEKVDSPLLIGGMRLLKGKLLIDKVIQDSVKIFNVHDINEALAEHRATWKDRAALYKRHYEILFSCKDQIPASELERVFTYRCDGVIKKVPATLYDGDQVAVKVKELASKALGEVNTEERDYFVCPDGSYIAFCDDLCAKIVGKDFPADYYVYLEKEPATSDTHIFAHDERVDRFIKTPFAECQKFVKGNVAARKKAVLRKKLPLALELLLDYADFDATGFVNENGVAVPNLRLYGAIVPHGAEQQPIECQFEWGFDVKGLAACYHWVAREKPLNKNIAQKASALSHYKIGALDS